LGIFPRKYGDDDDDGPIKKNKKSKKAKKMSPPGHGAETLCVFRKPLLATTLLGFLYDICEPTSKNMVCRCRCRCPLGPRGQWILHRRSDCPTPAAPAAAPTTSMLCFDETAFRRMQLYDLLGVFLEILRREYYFECKHHFLDGPMTYRRFLTILRHCLLQASPANMLSFHFINDYHRLSSSSLSSYEGGFHIDFSRVYQSMQL
jgi:hypothetical protein